MTVTRARHCPTNRGAHRRGSAPARRRIFALLVGLATLAATVVVTAVVPTPVTVASAATGKAVPSYWLVASDGGVFAFGGLASLGSMGGQHLNKPIVGMAATSDGQGYWLDASDGGIFAFGDAHFYGSMGGTPLNQPVVSMAATPDGKGYWLVASDGGIFAFGDAPFYGSMGGVPLNQPVVGMATTKDGGGYWLVASDGGIFAFGDATFHGSTGSLTLNRPVVSMAPSSGGNGYWLVASDGGIFAFGDAPFYGSEGGTPLSRPIVAMGPTPDGDGYWFTDSGGLIFNFGAAGYYGSAPPNLNAPVVGMTVGLGSGTFNDPSYPSGSYGFDISNWQCNAFPPAPHQIGIVEVAGQSYGSVNQCLADEANWAGAGLNLYLYLTYGAQLGGPSYCLGTAAPTTCNTGYGAAQYAFQQAQNAGVDTSVTWWLDVEGDPSWSTDTAANASLVQGAVAGLQAEGVPNVGIYSQQSHWSSIVGSYSPSLPEWVANYGSNVPPFNPAQYCSYNFASGPVWLVQFTDGANTNGFDNDYAC
jgi:hypothetical protein